MAVPLLKLGFSLHIALPLVTTMLTLLPFFVCSQWIFRKKSAIIGVFILSLPLLLPVEYDLITTIPRGFVTGVALSGSLAISVFYLPPAPMLQSPRVEGLEIHVGVFGRKKCH